MDTGALHLTSDNTPMSDDEFHDVTGLIEKARHAHADMVGYVTRQGLSPEIHLPGGDWRVLGSGHFPNWTRSMIEHARFCSPFSGFDLILWAVQGSIDGAVRSAIYTRFFGGEFDAGGLDGALAELGVHQRMLDTQGELIRRWTDLIRDVPDRYRVRLPATAGEMGVLHDGRIVNSDALHYQSRMNALYAVGELDRLEEIARTRGVVEYLEIGPGAANFAVLLKDCLGGRLRAHLIELPLAMANACAYLGRAAGFDNVDVIDATATRSERPFVLVPNYLLPAYERHLPSFDLVHNVISMNEMNESQVKYYAAMIGRRLDGDGLFYLSGGHRVLDSHVDARSICVETFPYNRKFDADIRGIRVIEPTNLFATDEPATRRPALQRG